MKLDTLFEDRIDQKKRERISNWIDKYLSGMVSFSYKIEAETGIVNFQVSGNKNLVIRPGDHLSGIAIKFGKIEGGLIIPSNFKTYRNLPKETTKALSIGNDVGSTFSEKDFKYLPKKMGTLLIDAISLKSFKGIHEHVQSLDEIWIEDNIESHVLGILKIPGVKKCASTSVTDAGNAADILNKYLGQGNAGIIKAQRELIDADLDDYAEF